jgi:RNA polymerase sigma-70 factor (ECF subfamily)
MYRVALNVAISWVRGHGARQQVTVPFDAELHDVAGAVADPAGDERQRVLAQVIQALDPLSRALLLLYLDDHSYRDIAGVLGLTETNVATRISRLKQCIKQDIGHLA